jgi:LuxR family maltose regulon positive regulatory protein
LVLGSKGPVGRARGTSDTAQVHWYQPVAERLVVRPRLLALLDAEHRLTLIRAPIGFGKSVLVKVWAETRVDSGSDTALVSLGPHHRTGEDLWRAVAVALAPTVRIQPREGMTAAGVRALLAQRERPVTLVIDRLDRVATPVVVEDLLGLLAWVPTLRLVLSVRTTFAECLEGAIDPVDALVPHARLVGGMDLLLTSGEMVDLFATAGLDRTPKQVRAIYRAAGGWPRLARTLLAAIAESTGRVDDEETAARVLREHLNRDVLPSLTAEDTAVFQALAVPTRLTAGNAALLLDVPEHVATRVLARLDSLGVFGSTVEDGERVYRWPSAVREALRDVLGTDGERVRVRALDLTTARWHVQRGELAAALRHAQEAGADAFVRQLLERYWLPLLVYHPEDLAHFFRTAPAAWLADNEFLYGVRDLTLRLPGDPDIADLPSRPDEVRRRAASPDVRNDLNLGIVQLFVLRRAHRLDEALDVAHRLQGIAAAARVARPGDVSDLLAPIFLLTAIVHELSGDVVGAIAALRWAAETAETSVLRGSARHTAAHLAMDLALLGDLDEAETWLERSQLAPMVDGWVSPRARIAATIAELLIATGRLDGERARDALRRLLSDTDPLDELWPAVLFARGQYALMWGNRLAGIQQMVSERASRPDWAAAGSDLDALMRAAEVDLLLSLGLHDRAVRAIEVTARASQPLSNGPRARAALLSGDPAAALELVRQCLLGAPTARRTRDELLILGAVALHRLGRAEEAEVTLASAAAEVSRPALQAFAMVPRADLRALAPRASAASGIAEQLERAGVTDAFPVSTTPVRLTRREQVVLRYLASGLSRDAIAQRLSVSSNTVKSQTHSIYRKLGARSRIQAVLIAREQRLLDLETVGDEKDEIYG